MPKHTPKELSDTARNRVKDLICRFGIQDARQIVKNMVDVVEAGATDLEQKYGSKRL